MRTTVLGVLIAVLLSPVVAMAQQPAATSTVDCNKGQSLNQTLAKLNKLTSNAVTINGTCTEYVQVLGFQNLLLKGLPGAALVQPSTSAGSTLTSLLYIEGSHSVQVESLNIQADTSTVSAVAIGHGSSDIRLRSLVIKGGTQGIVVFENSQVSIAYVHASDPGYSTVGIYDLSDVHIEHSIFENTSGSQWHIGIALGASHVTLYATTIHNMQQGIAGANGSIVDLVVFNTYYSVSGSTDVVIDSPLGVAVNSVALSGGSLNVNSARLVLTKSGQSSGETSSGVLLDDGATMSANGGLVAITGSLGQGIAVMNNSHANLSGIVVSGGGHAGLLAVNNSTIDIASNNALSTVGGNAVDLFCDSDSKITGSGNIAGSPTAQCTHLLSTETVALP